ncbi:hypothetical protein J4216_01595 [Candidatus Woesearchaeota archaeon]|nr:hypothetical protein [Candidatus Woesearchaeota archaeon]
MALNNTRRSLSFVFGALAISSLTYSYHENIESIINRVKSIPYEAEPGFPTKEQGRNIGVLGVINFNSRYELYLNFYQRRIPIYLREDGLMVGDPDYTFEKFTEEEKRRLVFRWMELESEFYSCIKGGKYK